MWRPDVQGFHTSTKRWGLYWKAVLEVSQGYLGLPLLKVNKKNAWEGKQHFQGLCGHLLNPPQCGYLIKVWETEARCPNATRLGEVLLLPEAPQSSWISSHILPLLCFWAQHVHCFALEVRLGKQSIGHNVCTVLLPQQPAFPTALVWTPCKVYFKFSTYFHSQAQFWAGIFLFLCAIWYLHCCYIVRNFYLLTTSRHLGMAPLVARGIFAHSWPLCLRSSQGSVPYLQVRAAPLERETPSPPVWGGSEESY